MRPFSICVLTYGDHPHLAKRCIESIRQTTPRSLYRLIVGANAVSKSTETYLKHLAQSGHVDQLLISRRNINKCPMMRRMFRNISSEFICWFDDDSYLTEPKVLCRYLELARKSPASTVMWGQEAFCRFPQEFTNLADTSRFVRTASWYRGLTPPFWEPGGKGEFDFEGKGTGDGHWLFITGGFWVIRSKAIRALDWPDRRLIKLGDDVLLGEALRQHGWIYQNTRTLGVAISASPRRGDVGKVVGFRPRIPSAARE